MDVAVDAEGLRDLARDLRRLRDDLDDFQGIVGDYLPAAPPRLAETLGNVANHWAAPRRLIGGLITEVADALEQAADGYRDVDSHVGASFDGRVH
jgi:hypothetical protein